MIKLRKDQLQDEEELEKVKKKRRLDFLDILLFARVSVSQRPVYHTESAWEHTALMTPLLPSDGEWG